MDKDKHNLKRLKIITLQTKEFDMNLKEIYFAGGCFWGTEHYMNMIKGVVKTETGYANGHLQNPTYQEVYTDQTGHAECVKVTYDSNIISLTTLCRLFFKSIDPVSLNRQGEDVGTRYRTGIYWVQDSDKAYISQVFEEVQKLHDQPLAVEICPLELFYPAEEYHQKYLVKNPTGYCHISAETMKIARDYSNGTLQI